MRKIYLISKLDFITYKLILKLWAAVYFEVHIANIVRMFSISSG